jgi:hypothetical protein
MIKDNVEIMAKAIFDKQLFPMGGVDNDAWYRLTLEEQDEYRAIASDIARKQAALFDVIVEYRRPLTA